MMQTPGPPMPNSVMLGSRYFSWVVSAVRLHRVLDAWVQIRPFHIALCSELEDVGESVGV